MAEMFGLAVRCANWTGAIIRNVRLDLKFIRGSSVPAFVKDCLVFGQVASVLSLVTVRSHLSNFIRAAALTIRPRLPASSFNRPRGCGRGERDAASLDGRAPCNDGRRHIWPMSAARAERASVRRQRDVASSTVKKYQIRPS
ncbi:hypothetical protein MSG28_005491 [Choristoneura fumiferana]|uniref:Uncharacterized protein n=1 Tax=Choristoneura fumiferana TaxID=7141 RepID=A0ACC0KZQ2_CHOFU|nr:hypothetical protein MSG28_005491 [Choristoneura fumiferana]